MAELLSIHPKNPEPRKIARVVDVLTRDGIIIYPTDTVYGIGCDLFNRKAVEKLCQFLQIKPQRLKKDIPLQADPTLVFAANDFTIKRVLNEHKEIESPYNTYKYAGLPPGPINMPYISSIDAVLNYQKHNYFYMCAKEDFSGNHNFAATLAEHQRNAVRYQRALSAEMRKAAQKKN